MGGARRAALLRRVLRAGRGGGAEEEGSEEERERGSVSDAEAEREARGSDTMLSVACECTVVSRKSVREAVERVRRAHEERGVKTEMATEEEDEDWTADDWESDTLPTLPKVHERLSNNATALKSVLSNIDRHIARTLCVDRGYEPRNRVHERSFVRAGSAGADAMRAATTRSEEGAQASSSSAAIDTDVSVVEAIGADEGDNDDSDGLVICNSAPSAVVELFTHQGDREAFDAEEMLQSVCGQSPSSSPLCSTSEATRAAAGTILRLTFHVDIWDTAQWRDSLAARAHSQRQRGYGVRLGLRSLYVPQIVINGSRSVAGGGDATRTIGMLRRTLLEHPLNANNNRAFIFMRFIADERRIEAFLAAAKDTDAEAARDLAKEAPDVWLVLFDACRGTRIGRINRAHRGTVLEECNVVRSCSLVRKWTSGKPLRFSFTLPPRIDGAALLLQHHSHGPIITASSIQPGAAQVAPPGNRNRKRGGAKRGDAQKHAL